MILLCILFIMLLLLIALTISAISVGGVVFVVLFGDVIVGIGFIIWLIRRLIIKRKNGS